MSINSDADPSPRWAMDRVRQLVDEQTRKGWSEDHLPSGVHYAFARYIAAHEQAPVDPLEAEAQQIADDLQLNLSAMPRVERALKAALRRGMELSKSGATS